MAKSQSWGEEGVVVFCWGQEGSWFFCWGRAGGLECIKDKGIKVRRSKVAKELTLNGMGIELFWSLKKPSFTNRISHLKSHLINAEVSLKVLHDAKQNSIALKWIIINFGFVKTRDFNHLFVSFCCLRAAWEPIIILTL